MSEPSRVRLSKQERRGLCRLLQGGLQPVRTVLRALALRQLADGKSVREVAKSVGLIPKTVWLTVQRDRQGGLERALYERPGPSPWMNRSGNASWPWPVVHRRKAARIGGCVC